MLHENRKYDLCESAFRGKAGVRVLAIGKDGTTAHGHVLQVGSVRV